jgi:hypothetical protein
MSHVFCTRTNAGDLPNNFGGCIFFGKATLLVVHGFSRATLSDKIVQSTQARVKPIYNLFLYLASTQVILLEQQNLPSQGNSNLWRMYQNYILDYKMHRAIKNKRIRFS